MPSTAVGGFGDDEAMRTLVVPVVDGDLYAYTGAGRETHDAFKAAFSKGRFFSRRFGGRYPYAKRPDPRAWPPGDRAWPPPAAAGH